MQCPQCGKVLDPARHGDLTCDGEVWCDQCRQYEPELLQPREFAELENWAASICAAFGQAPVPLQHDPASRNDWRIYLKGDTCCLAEADHEQRAILLYPPGHRLTSLCHELAHIFTRQDHTETWARTFAELVAWVKARLFA